ncbi:MAG TPA: DUF6326 family protein [Cyclobacteriaceae bacterium]
MSTLKSFEVNPRIKLAFLWTTIMALYIYADFFNLMTPNSIQKMMELKTPLGPTTPGILIGFSILLIIPALMIPCSIMLSQLLSKWLNIIMGILYGIISALIIIMDIGNQWMAFFILYQFVELFIFALIIHKAWNWPLEVEN